MVELKKTIYGSVKEIQGCFWDVLTYDYDKFVSPEKCLENGLKYTRNGSIIVFMTILKPRKI